MTIRVIDDFDARKRQSVAQLLFRAARLLNERALARMREETGLPIRAAHTTLFPHIDLEGTRLTELAERVGISKQAVGQLVTELEEMGGLERVPDPDDRRAKLVRFTRVRGRLSVADGLEKLIVYERELAAAVGERTMKELHRGLLKLLVVLSGD